MRKSCERREEEGEEEQFAELVAEVVLEALTGNQSSIVPQKSD